MRAWRRDEFDIYRFLAGEASRFILAAGAEDCRDSAAIFAFLIHGWRWLNLHVQAFECEDRYE
jgi:hypothetical protein